MALKKIALGEKLITECKRILNLSVDDNGNLIWESYKSGSWGYEITYEYDEKNGLIREIEKNKDKDEIYVYENEYILINK